jgi:hypothetical protein
MKPATLLAIDVETSGPSFAQHALLSIGCSLQNEQKQELDHFSVNIKIPEGRCFDKECEGLFWDKHKQAKNHIQKSSTSPELAMEAFENFIQKIDRSYTDLILVSDNPCFDVAWIDNYLSVYTSRKPLRYHSITNSYRMIWDASSIQKIWLCIKMCHPDLYHPPRGHVAKLGLNAMHSHQSLDDARIIADRYIDTLEQITSYIEKTSSH